MMEYFNQEAAWYTGPQGVSLFAGLKTLEEQTLFLYAALRKRLHTSYDKDNTCFKLALFFAEAVQKAPVPYKGYPDLVDPTKNPFMAFLTNWNQRPGNRALFYGLMCVLHGLDNPMLANSWLYDKSLMESDKLQEKLLELDRNFYDEEGPSMPNPLAYDIDEQLQDLQIKLVLLFDKV